MTRSPETPGRTYNDSRRDMCKLRVSTLFVAGMLCPPVHPQAAPSTDGYLEAVSVRAMVLDKHQQPVTDLPAQAFRVFEDGVEQRLAMFRQEESPISFALVIDVSGSMAEKASALKEAVDRFCKASNPASEFLLVEVAQTPKVGPGFTRDAAALQAPLADAPFKGRTPLFDVIYLALRGTRTAHYPSKAVVVITDGGENLSRIRESEIQRLVEAEGIPILGLVTTMRYGPRAATEEESIGQRDLENLIQLTGGWLSEPGGLERLPGPPKI